MISKKKKLGLLLIIGFVFPLFLNYSFIFSNKHNYITDNPKISGIYYDIEIDDSATGPGANNWTWARTQPWCTKGDGTQENPYVIEDSIFLPSGLSDCLTVANSSKYFVVENCTFKDTPVNGYSGIRLKNVINAFIIDNQVYNNSHGIYCVNVNNSRIIDNNCSDNAFYGIYFNDNCVYNTISGNIVNNNNGDGIYLFDFCHFNNISGNTVNGSYHGIYIEYYCNNNTISGNIVNNSAVEGIFLYEYCDNNTISGNTANKNGYGIYIELLCHNNTISGNIVNNNNHYGIFLLEGENNTISGNTANNNDYGIYFDGFCDKNRISGNTVNDNDYGVYIRWGCDNNAISGNTASDNNFEGITLDGNCYFNQISENIVKGSNYGIFLYDSLNNTILGNTVRDNNVRGIYIEEDCDYNEITENIIYNNSVGVDLYGLTENNLVYKNYFLKNGKHATDSGISNMWNSTAIGNYWDNWTSPDVNSDGIVDDPYTYIGGSTGSIDYLPIAEDGAPRISIISPSEGQRFGSAAPSFSLQIVDVKVFETWYTLDGGLNNYTFTGNGTINQVVWGALSEGNVTITFYARDIAENVAFEEVTIVKDIPAGGLDPGVIAVIVVVSVIGGAAIIGAILVVLEKKGKISFERIKEKIKGYISRRK